MESKRLQLIDKISRIAGEASNEADLLMAAVSLIDDFSENFNWTGFYMMKGDKLEVGPYIGPETPHTEITLNSGICGAAASNKETIVVDDVNADPRFLACSLSTRSEIVVPLMDGQECLGDLTRIAIAQNNRHQFKTGKIRL